MARKFAQKLLLDGGLNLTADSRAIADNELVKSKNMFPNMPGILEKRAGFVSLTLQGANSVRMFVPDKSTGIMYVLVEKGDPDGYVLMAYESLTTSLPKFTQTVSAAETLPSVLNYNGETFFCFGYPIEGFYVLSATGFRHESFAFSNGGMTQTQEVPVMPKIAGTYFKRVVWGNFGPGRENTIVYADEDNASYYAPDFDSTIAAVIGNDALQGFDIALDHLAGDEITAVQQISLADNANPMQSALLVLGKQRGVILTGETLETVETPPANGSYFGTLQPNALSRDCGCFGPEAICTSPEGVFWAGQDNVWFLPNGASPQPMGDKIKPVLTGVASGWHDRVVVKYFNQRIVLGVPSERETIISDAAQTAVPALDFYWLDLKFGAANARWYGPMTYGPFREEGTGGVVSAVLFNVTGQESKLLGCAYETGATYVVDMIPVAGSEARDVCQTFVSNYTYDVAQAWTRTEDYGNYVVGDIVRPRFHKCGLQFERITDGSTGSNGFHEPPFASGTVIDGSSSSDHGTWEALVPGSFAHLETDKADVLGEVRTKTFDFGASGYRKTLKQVLAELYTSSPQTVLCRDIQALGGRTEEMSTVLGRAGNTGLPGVLPFGAAKNYSHRSFRPDSSDVLVDEHHQFEFADSNGYVVDDTNDVIALSILFGQNADGEELLVPEVGLVRYYRAPLNHGIYATAEDLMTEIVFALNAYANTWDNGVGVEAGATTLTWSAVTVNGIWRIRMALSGPGALNGLCKTPVLLFEEPELINTYVVRNGFNLVFQGNIDFNGYGPIDMDQVAEDSVKCGRLMSMLGFDISSKMSDVDSAFFATDVYQDYLNWAAEDTKMLVGAGSFEPSELIYWGSSPMSLWADFQVGKTNPVQFAVTGAEAQGTILGGQPFTRRDR